jgi:hypothetical protein
LGSTDIGPPAEYKRRSCRKERVDSVVEPEDLEPRVEKVGQLRRNFVKLKAGGMGTAV